MFCQVKGETESGDFSGSEDSNYHPGREPGTPDCNTSMRATKSCQQNNAFEALKAAKSKNETWTEAQNKLLFEYQRQYGNCWSIIAKKLSRYSQILNGRSDNSVKNHFYSTFRKSVRHINKFIKQYCRRFKIKSISNRALLSILAASQEVRLHRDEVTPETIQRCQAIKVCLIKYSSETATFDKGDLFDLIRQILDVNQEIKHQKNLQTESIISTIGHKTGLLPSLEWDSTYGKHTPLPEAKSQVYLLPPMAVQQLQQQPLLTVSAATGVTLAPPQPAFYPMMQPMGLPCPPLLYYIMAPYGISQS